MVTYRAFGATLLLAGSNPTHASRGSPAFATQALHLRELGLSDRVITQHVGVSDKTVGTATR